VAKPVAKPMAKKDKPSGARTARGDAGSLPALTSDDTGMLDAIDLPAIIINRDGRVARINLAATAALGFTTADVGRPPGEILAGVENLDRLCAQAIAGGAPCRMETRNGDRTFLLRIAAYTGSDREIAGAVLTFTNVTAFRASIEQAIYERESSKAILNAVADPLVVLDSKLRVQTANRAFHAMFGVSRDRAQGVSIRKLGSSEWETSAVWTSMETSLSNHTEFTAIEISREFPGMGRRTILLNARELAREADALILLTFHDITELKQAERMSSLVTAIVDSSDDAIVSKNLDGFVTSWNKGAERLFGYTAQEAVGRHITLIVPRDRQDEEATILQRLRRGERVEHFETLRIRKDGTIFDCSLTISPVRDVAGRVVGASKVARDITARKQTEAELKAVREKLEERVQERTAELWRKNKEAEAQADLMRGLSRRLLQLQDHERRRIARELHDSVGQLLAAINMNISTVSHEIGNLSVRGAECVEENSRLVEQVSQEIRTLSHLLHPPLLDEIGLKSALIEYVEGFVKRSKIEVALEIPAHFDRLSQDLETSLFRIVQECLTNIHRHSGSATAAISIVRTSEKIQLEVRDAGRGIEQETQSALNSSDAGGVGLRGMRERVAQLGGSLEIHSNGNGTTVTATMPLILSRSMAAKP
jgi:PAS domain S-box-containing protein